MKKCRKFCRLDLLKSYCSPKMAPEIRAEIPRTAYVVHTTFLANPENSCA